MKIEASVEVSNVVVVAATAIIAGVVSFFINEALNDDEPEKPVADGHVCYATFADPSNDRHQAFQ